MLNKKKTTLWIVLLATIAVLSLLIGPFLKPQGDAIVHEKVSAVILKIDKTNQTMTVEGTDEDSVIGDKCIVTWEKDALITLATNSGPKELSLTDFSVGDHVIMSIGEVQESYPTRVKASSIQLQPSGA